MKVSDVMTKDVYTLSPDQTLAEAAKLLLDKDVGGVPVTREKRVVGMLSERDLLDARLNPRPPRYLELLGGIIYLDNVSEYQSQLKKTVATKVEQVMTKNVISVDINTPVVEAARLIRDHGINRIPVLDGERLVGIVTRHDVLQGMVRQ